MNSGPNSDSKQCPESKLGQVHSAHTHGLGCALGRPCSAVSLCALAPCRRLGPAVSLRTPDRIARRPGRVAGPSGRVARTPGRVARTLNRVPHTPGRVARTPGRVARTPGRVSHARRCCAHARPCRAHARPFRAHARPCRTHAQPCPTHVWPCRTRRVALPPCALPHVSQLPTSYHGASPGRVAPVSLYNPATKPPSYHNTNDYIVTHLNGQATLLSRYN